MANTVDTEPASGERQFANAPVPENLKAHTGDSGEQGAGAGCSSIRFRLACLVAACVLPVWLAAGFVIYHAYQNKRELMDGDMRDTARALALVTDEELGNMEASLTVLATSPSLDSGDLAAFHHQARMVLQNYKDGDIILADATGQQFVNSYLPYGTPLPQRNLPDAARSVFATGKPRISNLFRGAVTRRFLIGVDVPVFRNGRVVYDLAMTLPADRLAMVLAEQRLPPEWIGAIMDSNHVTVARTRFPEKAIGQRATNAAQWEKATEGTATVTNLDGTRMFDGFSRSAISGWTVVVGVPESIVKAELERWLWWTIAGMALLSVVGVWLAVLIARSVARIEEALRRSREWLQVTLTSIGDAVLAADQNGRVTFLNPAASRLTGWQPEQAEGQPSPSVLKIINEQTREPAGDVIARVLKEGRSVPLANHTALLSKDGREIPIEDSAAPILDSAGKVVGVVLVFHDVTEKRRAEEALMRSEKLASVGRMASSIAHEINNPLETIGHAVYLAASDPGISEQGKSYLNLASQELERVSHITKQTLAFHREKHTLTLVDLCESVESTLNMFSARLMSRNISVETRFSEVEPITAHGGEIRQVIANLLSNSMDAVPRHGKILLRLSRSTGRDGVRLIRFTIGDTGSGIPPERCEKIFEPFFTTKDVIGTGLGLWVTKQIVEKHGASIRVRSKPGKGTVFSICFPIAEKATQVL